MHFATILFPENIHAYAQYAPGYMAGKSYNDTIKLTNHIYEPQTILMTTMPLYLSFDIQKWSPGMPIAVHQFLDNMYADVFGVPSLNEASRIFTDGDMHYIKENVHFTAEKPSRDFEGFAGKKLTMWHIGVMGYAVNRLRALKLIEGHGRFASLIDDGLLRVDVDATDFKGTVKDILQVVEEVYNMWGLELSWDKTFVSSYFSIFLHNIRWQKVVVNAGSRVLGKITNRAEVPVPCVVSDLEVPKQT